MITFIIDTNYGWSPGRAAQWKGSWSPVWGSLTALREGQTDHRQQATPFYRHYSCVTTCLVKCLCRLII